MGKQVTRFQRDIHATLTGALLASPAVGTWLGLHLYSVGWLSTHAAMWAVLVPTVVLLAWLDTEVQWRKREARFRKVVARLVGN